MKAKCTVDHAALRSDKTAWSELHYVGQQVTPADEHGPLIILELRDCTCGSTISKDITP